MKMLHRFSYLFIVSYVFCWKSVKLHGTPENIPSPTHFNKKKRKRKLKEAENTKHTDTPVTDAIRKRFSFGSMVGAS